MTIFGGLAWALVTVAVPTVAQEVGQQRIAVLELDNPAQLKDQEIAYLSELIRSSARENLLTGKFLVMTHENIVELLGNRSLGECLGDCAVETGRNLGAAYIAAGQVFQIGTELRLSVTLYEVASGNLLGSKQAGGSSVLTLEGPLKDMGRKLFAKLGGGPAEEDVTPPNAQPPRGIDMASQKEKNPSTALVLSFFVPGLGQHYNGDMEKGLVQEILVGGGLFLLLTYGDSSNPNGGAGPLTTQATVGVGAMCVGWLWSVLDAPRGARRHNERLAENRSLGQLMDHGDGRMTLRMEFAVGPQGKHAVGVGAHF
jgi:hypothetical protein